MKILMLSSFYPPVLGGMARNLQRLSHELIKRGHQVTVCTIKQSGQLEIEDDDGVKVIRLHGFFQKIPLIYKESRSKWHAPAYDWFISQKLAGIIERENPDIIHTHCWFLYSVLPLKNRFKIPLVHSIHDYALVCPKRSAIKDNTVCINSSLPKCLSCMTSFYGLSMIVPAYYSISENRKRLTYVDKYTASCDFAREIHQKSLHLSAQNIVTIPNFLLSNTLDEREQDSDLPDDFILYVGWLAPYKGMDVLIEAYQKLNLTIKLVVMGIHHPDCHYRSAGNITVLKDVPHNTVMKFMSRCRFTVVPSTCLELCPTVALEAMSQSKAVIASCIGGLRELVVDQETGIHVPPNNPDELAKAIRFLLDNPDIAMQMGANGYQRFRDNYTQEVIVPQYIQLYRSLV